MSDEPALLAAICADPGDDTPRLVYADWLDEHDRHLQAELLRVQIELSKLVMANEKRDRLRWRESVLLAGPVDEWIGEIGGLRVHSRALRAPGDAYWFCVGGLSDNDHPEFEVAISRGLVGMARGPWDFWHKHADSFRNRHPIQVVELTTIPDVYQLLKRVEAIPQGMDRASEMAEWLMRLTLSSDTSEMERYLKWIHSLCLFCWPKANFALPPIGRPGADLGLVWFGSRTH